MRCYLAEDIRYDANNYSNSAMQRAAHATIPAADITSHISLLFISNIRIPIFPIFCVPPAQLEDYRKKVDNYRAFYEPVNSGDNHLVERKWTYLKCDHAQQPLCRAPGG